MPLSTYNQKEFSFLHSKQIDLLYTMYNSAEIKAFFDSQSEELRANLNGIISVLGQVLDNDSGADNIGATAISTSPTTVQGILEWLHSKILTISNITDKYSGTTDGDSGADNIGATPISTSPSTVQGILEWLYTQINSSILGQIPDGSLTKNKLAFNPATQEDLTVVTDNIKYLNINSTDETYTNGLMTEVLEKINGVNYQLTTNTYTNSLLTNVNVKRYGVDGVTVIEQWNEIITYTNGLISNITKVVV